MLNRILVLSFTILLLTGCNLKDTDAAKTLNSSLETTKQDLNQAKNNIDNKIDQAKQVQKEFNELSEAWNNLKN